eukprot:CFRG5489T1
MHPQLAPHVHPTCQEAIEQLEGCHRTNKFKKFLGACNDAKNALDRCLYEEYKIEQKKNLEAGRKRRARYERGIQEMANAESSSP